MKKLLLISLFLCSVLNLSAQAPQQFNFQGVARDAAGKAVANTTVSLRLTIHEGLPGGVNVYQETHKPLTSNGGIFTVSVGSGNDKSGSISDIKWSGGSFFLQVELDAAGGNNYIDLGATQLLSVPFALHAGEADRWKDGDPVVQRGIEGQGGILSSQIDNYSARLIWYPRKSAFRAGYATGVWNDENIGLTSTAFGFSTIASGEYSFAAGSEVIASGVYSSAFGTATKATGTASFAMGYNTTAAGDRSLASGSGSIATGNNSTALGANTRTFGGASVAAGNSVFARAYGSVSVGSYNNDQDNPDVSVVNELDRIFQVGNGNANNRSNAVTVLRNGFVGIGKDILEPKFILDIQERPRIRFSITSINGSTAGVFLDDSNGSPEGFVGMTANSEIGFYNAKKWQFWIDKTGNAHIIGSNYNSSDRRLKRNFTSLSSSLTKLSDLNGYHYFWKDSTLDQTLQTGLIAQEVETHFPELVKTDDKGFKSVNYTGLIPHLIESVKELDKKYQEVKSENDALKAALKRVDKLEATLNKLVFNTNEVSQTSDK
jgi:hypothetical protein